MIEQVNEIFQSNKFKYPFYNEIQFEEYFYNRFINERPTTNRSFIPIFWTNYFNNKGSKNEIINYFNNLDKSKKYFTVLDYFDFNIKKYYELNKIDGLDLLVFSGSFGDIPIPLISSIRNYIKPHKNFYEKKYKWYFRGYESILRNKLINFDNIYFTKVDFDTYLNEINDSKFSLCPRGSGYNSYRFYESLFFNCVPVYISNYFTLPFPEYIDWDQAIIKINEKEVEDLEAIIDKYNNKESFDKYTTYINSIQKYISEDFTYEYIIDKIK